MSGHGRKPPTPAPKCGCGCGVTITSWRCGKWKRFLVGHSTRKHRRDGDTKNETHGWGRVFRRYGLTRDDFWKLLEKQGGVCAICGTSEPGKGRTRMCVDHCHRTGKVRGLLCGSCNRSIGQLGDDPDILQRAADYLLGAVTCAR